MKVFKLKVSLQRLTLLVLLVFCGNVFAMAGDVKITGRVTDQKGELLVGVTVLQKGTTNGVATDPNGSYTLVLTDKADPVVQVSYIGFKTYEFKVTGKKGIWDVVLEEETKALDEVVIVGYGQQRKVSVLGAQAAMKAEDMKIPTANISSVLAGRLAGVVAVQRTGEPGHDDSDIWIRGISTFGGNNAKPLVLVDGVERSFSNLAPEDIESFTVLKDASATAVYGVRGANGVILIKTKPGRIGKPVFKVDYYEGMTRLTKKPKLADGITYMEAANEAYGYSNNGEVKYKPEYIEATKKASGLIANDDPNLYNKYLYPNVNWMKEVFKDWGHNRRANVNVTGGSPNVSYYVSLSYYNEKGLTRTDNTVDYDSDMRYDRYNFTTNLNIKASEKTKLDVGVSGFVGQGNYPGENTSDIFGEAMTISPVDFPALYPDNTIPSISTNGGDRNPYGEVARRGYKEETTNMINSNVRVTQDLDFWDWSKGLSVTAMYAFDVDNWQKMKYSCRESGYFISASKDPDTGLWIDPYDEDGNLKTSMTYEGGKTLGFEKDWRTNRNTYVEASMNYDRVFNDVHRVGALCLFNMKVKRISNVGDLISSMPYKNQGLAGRLTYSYDDRYFAEFNIGYNGSENFSPSKRFGVFPAFGLGWAASNEKFFEVLKPWFSYLKFRYTDGKVGDDVAGGRRFAYMDIMKSDGNVYSFGDSKSGRNGVYISDFGSNVKWSVSHKQDLGIDMKFFNDDLSVTLDLFKEHRTNIFLRRESIPLSAGLTQNPYGNLGVIDNKGIEATVEYRKQFGENIFLTVRGNFTWNEDEIKENDQPNPAYPWLDKRGHNSLGRWAYVAEGLFTSDADIQGHASQFGETNPGDISRVGDIKYKDLNKDGHIDSNDKMCIGQGDVPRLMYGFGFDFQYKNFSIGALFQGIGHADRMLSGSSILPFQGSGGTGNLYSNITNRWSPDDPTNEDVFYPRLAYGSGDAANTNNFQESTWWQKDVSFLRLKQLTISYQLPKKWFNKTAFKNASVYAMGNNVLTFSKFKLWDPELNTNNGTSYPNVSSYSIGVNFSF